MNKQMLRQLKTEANKLGCDLIMGKKFKLVTYDYNGFREIQFFDADDFDCVKKIQVALEEIKEKNLDDFYSMSGSLHQLRLEIKYVAGDIYVFEEETGNLVKNCPCNPTGLKDMVKFVSDGLIEYCEDCQSNPAHILAKNRVPLELKLQQELPAELLEYANKLGMTDKEIVKFVRHHPEAVEKFRERELKTK